MDITEQIEESTTEIIEGAKTNLNSQFGADILVYGVLGATILVIIVFFAEQILKSIFSIFDNSNKRK
jgi:hypothetical protein